MGPRRNPPKVRSPVSLPPARSDRGRENSAVAGPGERMRAGNFFISQPVRQRLLVQNSPGVQSQPEIQHPVIREQPRLEQEEDRSVERCSVCELGSRTSAFISCDDCDRWFHTECAGVSTATMQDEEIFRCGVCTGTGMIASSQTGNMVQVPETGREVVEGEQQDNRE